MRRRFSIRNKILSIFVLIVVFFAANTVLNIYYLGINQNVTNRITYTYFPSDAKLGDLNLILHNSKSYVNSWVLTDIKSDEKLALKKIHTEQWPLTRKALEELIPAWESEALKDSINNLLNRFEKVVSTQQTLMKTLNTFADYTDFMKVAEADELAQNIFAETNLLIEKLQWIRMEISDDLADNSAIMLNSQQNQRFSNTTVGIIVMVTSLIIAFFLSNSITKPIQRLRRVIGKMSKGELPNDKLTATNDEVGEMTTEVNTLISGLKKVSRFAEDIGESRVNTDFTPLSEKDVLGNSLLRMRDNIRIVATEAEQRNWANQGLTNFSDILRRSEHLSIQEFCYQVIFNLVTYMELNQGYIYLVEQDITDINAEAFLELKAAYAYNRQKFLEKRIYLGQGITGQCWQEGEKIYMNDVPDSYVNIESGLGTSNPTSILIVPLKVNKEVFGIVELAGFRDLQSWEIEFCERASEMIGSAISVIRNNDRTRTLLTESQNLTENLRTQEEEMRQNFEELRSTQEEMNRREEVLQAKIKSLESALDQTQKDAAD